MSPQVDLREFLSGFLAEADEHLRSANAHLIAADEAARRGEPSPRAVRELFRSLHTIKGLAGMVGVEPIVDLAHEMESVLRSADRAGGQLTPAGTELLIAGRDLIARQVSALAEQRPLPLAPASLLEALGGLSAVPPAAASARPPLALAPELLARLTASEREQLERGPAQGKRAILAEFIPSPARAAEGLTINAVRERVGAIAEIVKIVPVSTPRSELAPGGLKFALLLLTTASDAAVAAAVGAAPADLAVVASDSAPAPPPARESDAAPLSEVAPETSDQRADGTIERPGGGSVRVPVGRVDEAMDGLAAAIVTRFQLNRAIATLAGQGVDVRALQQVADEHGRKLRALRAAVLRLRMVSMRELLESLPLLVRGLRVATGKKLNLQVDAGSGELDKLVAERILPAIIHLVRNAVDHGVEPPAERVAAGKPEEGLLVIRCQERGNSQLELSLSDDGRGIDRAEVARRAGRPVPTSDAALLDLLTLPGLSTRDEVTHTSGRGLGMDIVKRISVDELGGELSLRTSPGRGSIFTLIIPLTVTLLDGLLFECGGQLFVASITAVEEIIELEPGRVLATPGGGGGAGARLLERREELVPLVGLSGLLRLPPGPGGKALVVRRNGAPFAFEVDRMVGKQEIVVRPLEDPLVRVPGVPGVTDLGDGKPTLVIDLVALAGTLRGSGAARAEVRA